MAFDPRKKILQLATITDVSSLLDYFKKLDTVGRNTILKTISSSMTNSDKLKALGVIKGAVGNADKDVRDWLVKGIETSYINGVNQTVADLKSIKFKSVKGMPPLGNLSVKLLHSAPEFKPHLLAVNTLLSDAYLDFGNALTGYVKSSERILNDALKRQIRSAIAIGRLEGDSVRDIAKQVKTIFEDKGFTVLVSRNGREWSIDNYAEMLARTHLLKANNDGVINRAGDYNIDIVEFSSHGSDCEECSDLEGELFSISGNSDEYDALGDNEPPIHPNCKHTLLMRPDLSKGE
jgi:hypothetical protein